MRYDHLLSVQSYLERGQSVYLSLLDRQCQGSDDDDHVRPYSIIDFRHADELTHTGALRVSQEVVSTHGMVDLPFRRVDSSALVCGTVEVILLVVAVLKHLKHALAELTNWLV